MRFQDAFPVAMILGAVEAHTIFQQLAVGGTTYATGHAIRVPTYDGPINDVTTQYVACNGGPNPTTGDSNVINVKAGDTIQAIWRHTLTSTPANDNVYVVDPSHKGPVMAYMKKVNDAVTDVGYGGGWFKISQAGLNVATQTWAVTDLIAAGGVQQITIPSCIANGQYLLRAELIALHASGSPLGAQLYMECAQINVTGGTGTSTPSTVSFPGAYGQSDPGILINIYQTLSSYKIPGPDVFTCGSGSGPSNPTTTGKPTTMVTSTKPTTPVTTTSTAPGAGASLYGQCGGIGWTGPTTCMAGTCKGSSTYYSQCLP